MRIEERMNFQSQALKERVSLMIRSIQGQLADYRQEMIGYFESIGKRGDDKVNGKGVRRDREGILPIDSNTHGEEASPPPTSSSPTSPSKWIRRSKKRKGAKIL